MIGFEEYLEASLQCRRVDELEQLFNNTAEQFGFENVALASARNGGIEKIRWHKYPDNYMSTYLKERWERIDPILAFSFTAKRAFVWDELVAKLQLTKAQKNFIAMSSEMGVSSGISVPVHRPGSRVDLVSLSQRHADVIPSHLHPKIQAIATLTFERLHDLTGSEVVTPPTQAILTDREYECLVWTKDGKLVPEIAEMLSVSPNTVKFHIKNVRRKLGAATTLSAVVIAIQRGIISV